MGRSGFDAVVVGGLVLVAVLACKKAGQDSDQPDSGGKDEAQEAALAEKERNLAQRERKLEEERARNASKPPSPAPRAAPKGGAVRIDVSVKFDETKLDGNAWDGGSDKRPDPALAGRVASTGKTLHSRQSNNTFEHQASFEAQLAASDTVSFTAYDMDFFSKSDPGGTFSARFDGRAATRTGRNGAVTFTVAFGKPR